MNASEIDQLIRKRRSVFPKDYTGEKVSDEIINQMLENANWAPNHKLTEPWRFVVFTGDGLKQLAAFQSECYKSVTIANDTFREDRYQSLQTKPMQSSHFEEAKSFFGLGPYDKLCGFLHVGMPKATLPDGRRRPISEKVKWFK